MKRWLLLILGVLWVSIAVAQVTPPISLAPGNPGQFVTYGPNPPGNILLPAAGPAGGGLVFPTDPRIVIVDGVTYPYTSTGIQAAINAASAAATGGNGADVFLVPHANYALGTTGLTLPSLVCLIGLGDPWATALTYNGSGAAITMDAHAGNVSTPCLRNLYIHLGPSAADGAAAILIRSKSGTGAETQGVFQNLVINATSIDAAHANQAGILMIDETGNAPAAVANNTFRDINFSNISTYIENNVRNTRCTANLTPYFCCTGNNAGTCNPTGEHNTYSGIQTVAQFYQNALDIDEVDSHFEVLESSQGQNCAVGGCAGVNLGTDARMNFLSLVVDNGTTNNKAVVDTGTLNGGWISALTPHGTFAATDMFLSFPSANVGIADLINAVGVPESGAATPTLSSCSTGSLLTGSNSLHGRIQQAQVSCILTPGYTCNNKVGATATDETTVTSAVKVSAATASTITITSPGATDIVDYSTFCN